MWQALPGYQYPAATYSVLCLSIKMQYAEEGRDDAVAE